MYQTVDFFVPDDEVGKIGLISCCHHQVVHQDSGEAYGELFLTAVHVAEFGAGVVEDVDAQVIEPVNHGVYGAEAFAFSSGIEQCHHMYHGEKVAFGTLTQLVLENVPLDELEDIILWCIEVGLPVTLAELGAGNVTDDQLMEVAKTACAETDTLHNMPFEVTPETVFAAIKAADAYGRYYLDEEE